MHESPYFSEGLGGIRELSISASLKAVKLQQPAPFLGEGKASQRPSGRFPDSRRCLGSRAGDGTPQGEEDFGTEENLPASGPEGPPPSSGSAPGSQLPSVPPGT